ncbi:MAG TPA: epoxyqueuosine reductase [Syntrophobacteraceae bacterium]|nr:epoxyqueuosine reductase [Syntrophobacteraceae bacterium]
MDFGWLEHEIQNAISRWRRENAGMDFWRQPLAGVASANDPLFERLRLVVDPAHAAPFDILPSAKSVVLYFVPFQRWVGEENDRSGFYTARSWAECYTATNQLIGAVNQYLQDFLEKEGFEATTTPATHNFDAEKLVSRWSHKHLAYIAGLGTFGRNHLLITRAGCCGRLGSFVTSMELPPSSRPQEEWCLVKKGCRCSACISKCVYGALREDCFDRHACYRQCLLNDAIHGDLPLVDVCGKCGCNVPCSYGIPAPASLP